MADSQRWSWNVFSSDNDSVISLECTIAVYCFLGGLMAIGMDTGELPPHALEFKPDFGLGRVDVTLRYVPNDIVDAKDLINRIVNKIKEDDEF
jgi:hypothetical protein